MREVYKNKLKYDIGGRKKEKNVFIKKILEIIKVL